MKSASAARNLDRLVTSIRNPEIAAMAAIADVLEELHDPAARVRVMRWAFSHFSDEFTPGADAAPAPSAFPAPAPLAPVATHEQTIASDIESQIAELDDLFPGPSQRR